LQAKKFFLDLTEVSEVKMEVKMGVKRYALGVKPASWLDDSLGCCLPIWYCPF
jgi:hypothetical protein